MEIQQSEQQQNVSVGSLLLETGVGRSERRRWLSIVGLMLTSGGLGMSVLLAILISFNLISVPWNAVVLPRSALFGLLPLCLTGLVASIVSCVYYRDRASIVGIVLGVVGVLASLFAFLLIVATAVAAHPV